LRKGCALIALYVGYTEFDMSEMTFIFYKDLINEIAIKLNYETVVHLLGRDYSDESVASLIQDSNPMYTKDQEDKKVKKGETVTLGMLKNMGMIK
jgi:hypothetical protein